jgi:hypothetical protein
MRLVELFAPGRIDEASRIGSTRPGQVFVNPKTKQEITLWAIFNFPDSGAFEDDSSDEPEPLTAAEKAQNAVLEKARQLRIRKSDLHFSNSPNKAAMMTVWKTEDNRRVAFVRYGQRTDVSQHGNAWTNTQFKNEYGFTLKDSKVTHSETAKVKPSDLIGGKRLTPAGILKVVKQSNIKEPLKGIIYNILLQVYNGTSEPVTGAAEYRQVIEKYIGEIAGPIALLKSPNLLTGDWQRAQRDLLVDKSFTDLSWITFPPGQSTPLVDSFVSGGGDKIGISSKAKGGVSASLKSIVHILNTHEFDDQFLAKYKPLIDAINIISENTSLSGPLKLGQMYGMIDRSDAEEIVYLIKNGDKEYLGNSKNIKKLLKAYPDAKLDHPAYTAGFHTMAGLARLVSAHLNAMKPTTFFKKVLARISFIQLHSHVRKSGDDLVFDRFNVKYPPVVKGKIEFNAGSNYYATSRPKDKIAFSIS